MGTYKTILYYNIFIVKNQHFSHNINIFSTDIPNLLEKKDEL